MGADGSAHALPPHVRSGQLTANLPISASTNSAIERPVTIQSAPRAAPHAERKSPFSWIVAQRLPTRRNCAIDVPDRSAAYALRPANGSDAAQVTELVEAAYEHYVERPGMLPRPMTDDYAAVIERSRVTVAERHGAIVGVIVLAVTGEGFVIDNVAVHPSHRGRGLGRTMLAFADAQARWAGFESIYLYTHEQMTENLALYTRAGYVEFDRRSRGTFSLVYMRKDLRQMGARMPDAPGWQPIGVPDA